MFPWFSLDPAIQPSNRLQFPLKPGPQRRSKSLFRGNQTGVGSSVPFNETRRRLTFPVRRYRKEALVWHPDKQQGAGGDVDEANIRFKLIVEAYEVLSDGLFPLVDRSPLRTRF